MASFLSNRRLQRRVLGALRKWKPLSRWGNNVVVAPYAEVTEVLLRPEDFSVVPIYEQKMRRTSGDFYLGMDNTPQYARERELTNRALRAMDLKQYRSLARGFSEKALGDCQSQGALDVVQELSWLVPVQLCEEFFGVLGPDRRSLTRWVRYIFQHLFLNLSDDPVVAARAEVLATELRLHLAELVADRRAEPESQLFARKDFVSRLLQVQHESGASAGDEVIVRNVGGVILGSVDTISRSVINSLEELFARPAQLELAQRAARDGDRERVAKFAFEALRFNPHNPLIVRRTLRSTTLHSTTGHQLRIPAGSRVFALTYAAMFDPKQFSEPEEFSIDRPEQSHLQFGFGMHRCFGEQVALAAIPEILTPLLCQKNLQRATGQKGKLAWDGPFPDHFHVTFEASSVGTA